MGRTREGQRDVPEGTICAGGLREGGTRTTLCDRLAVASRPSDEAFVCNHHQAGAKAIRKGGAYNDNGKPHFVYLNRVHDGEYKVGRSQDPPSRGSRGKTVRVHLVPLDKYPTESWASIAEAVEHAVRVRLALGLGADVPLTGKESVITDDADHAAVVAAFDRLFPEVCSFIMR
jgi:hypothetical protein